MRISIQLEGSTSLRALPTIEVERLALIAGLNGIGKTTALRLLDLCLGRQPWHQYPTAWRSLRTSLATARIAIDDLAEGTSIVWKLDTAAWPPVDDASDPPVPNDDWFSIEANGAPVSLNDAQQLISVERISGDTTLLQTIASEIDDLAQEFGRLSARSRSRSATNAGELLTTAVNRLRAADGAELAERRRERDRAVEAGREARAAVARVMTQVSDLDQAIEVAQRAGRLSQALPTLDAEIAEVSARLDAANSQFERLRGELRVAELAAALARDRNNEVRNARRLAEQHSESLRRTSSALVEILTAIGIDAEDSGLGVRLHEQLRSTSSQLEEIRRHRHEIDATPLLDAALQDLLASLSRARARGIGEEVLVPEGTAAAGLTIDGLFDLLTRRRESLSAQTDEGTSELDEIIRRLEITRSQLQRATSLLQEQQRLPPLIERAERRIAAALAGAPNADRLKELSVAVTAAEVEVASLAEERAALAGRRLALADGASPEALRDRLASVLNRLGVTEVDDLHAIRLERLRDLAATRARADQAAQEVARAGDTLEASQLQHELARAAIDEDPFLSQLRARIPRDMGLSAAAAAFESVNSALQDLPNRLDEIRGVLAAGANHVHGRGQWPATPVAQRVESWLEASLGRWFQDPSVRSALFPTGDRVKVNLARRQVEWFEGTARRELPFEAFSSGQQAFAYTKARLEELGVSSTPNRLVALDEFGSFLAKELMDDLRSMLIERQAVHPRDSVILVLPATDDPEHQARTTTGRDRERYLARAAQLANRGYYMEELT